MVETYESLLDRIGTGSGSDLVSDRNAISPKDQVASSPRLCRLM